MNVMDLMMLMILALFAGTFVRWLCEKRWSNWR